MSKQNKIFKKSNCLNKDEIEKYKLNELSGEELHKVESHLIDCPLCSDAIDGALMLDNDSLKDDLLYISKNERSNSSFFRKNYFIYSSAAAILLLAITALLNISSNSNSQKLFNRYFEVYPDVTTHTRSNGNNDNFANAMLLYNSGKFEATIKKLDKIKKNESVSFYKGVSFLALNNTTKALEVLKPLTKDKENIFYYEANWYVALALLKLERIDESILYFIKLKDSFDYSDNVNNILVEIKTNE
jgi:hypothetical protein